MSTSYQCTNILEAHMMVRQYNPRDNPTASRVLDILNSGEESSSDNNESDEYDNVGDAEVTEERIKQGRIDLRTDSEQENELISNSSSFVPSLSSVLRVPLLSDLIRKRKTQANNPGKC